MMVISRRWKGMSAVIGRPRSPLPPSTASMVVLEVTGGAVGGLYWGGEERERQNRGSRKRRTKENKDRLWAFNWSLARNGGWRSSGTEELQLVAILPPAVIERLAQRSTSDLRVS